MAAWPGCGCGAGRCPSSEAGRMKSGLAVHLNDLPEPQARAVLGKCCGAPRWVARMLAARPFADDAAVHTVAEWTWWELSRDEWLQAFAAHPRIGERPPEEWSDREQAGMRAAAWGGPAAGGGVTGAIRTANSWQELARAKPDADGRVAALLEDGALERGATYRLHFEVGTTFFPYVDVVFTVRDDRHHHVPLILSPFGYSTYRGS